MNRLYTALAVLLFSIFSLISTTFAGTTINSANKSAYGANIDWMNAYADGTNGAVIGEYYCTGYFYSANVGWISLGSGSPANGIQYQDNSATDYGVNNDGLGNLTGYAYGANIGWINFEQTYGKPNVNLLTGQLSGYVWSANCGWISLSNAVASVQTDALWPGPLVSNGLPVPWLLIYFGTTNVNPNADPTGKGTSIQQDYAAGTNPNDSNSVLRITAQSFASGGATASLTWSSVPTRLYHIQKSPTLKMPVWIDSGLGLISPSGGAATSQSFVDTNLPMRFYRLQAVLPLSP